MGRITKAIRHVGLVTLEGALIAALAVSLIAGTTLAGKPPAAGGDTTSVRVDDGVFAGSTKAYAGPSNATWVRARCYQAGRIVYEQYRQFDATRTASLLLGPTPAWSSGPADCTAEDGYFRRQTTWRVTSSTTFHVTG